MRTRGVQIAKTSTTASENKSRVVWAGGGYARADAANGTSAQHEIMEIDFLLLHSNGKNLLNI